MPVVKYWLSLNMLEKDWGSLVNLADLAMHNVSGYVIAVFVCYGYPVIVGLSTAVFA